MKRSGLLVTTVCVLAVATVVVWQLREAPSSTVDATLAAQEEGARAKERLEQKREEARRRAEKDAATPASSGVSGTVRSQDGQPVPNAAVSFWLRTTEPEELAPDSGEPLSASGRPLSKHETVADAQGVYSLSELKPGLYTTRVTAKGFIASDVETHELPAEGRAEVDFVLEPEATVRGKVVDADGIPLPGVEVVFSDPSSLERARSSFRSLLARQRTTAVRTQTDVHGFFTGEGMAPGLYRVQAKREGHWHVPEELSAPTDTVVLRMRRAARVEGVVVDERDAPVSGAEVSLQSKNQLFELPNPDALPRAVTTDETGTFIFASVPEGRFEVSAEWSPPAARGTREAAVWLEVREGKAPKLRLKFEGSALLSGQVTDASGNPLAGVQVTASESAMDSDREGPGRRSKTVTDAAGRFTFGSLRPGRHRLFATKAGFSPRRSLESAETGATDVRLVLDAEARLTGRVVDSSGAPITEYLLDGKEVEDADGRFTLPIRETGERRLMVKAEGRGMALRIVTVEKGKNQSVPDIVLGASRRLQGQVLDARTLAPVGGARITAGLTLLEVSVPGRPRGVGSLDEATSDAAGRFQLELAKETVHAIASHDDYEAGEVDVAPGMTSHVFYLQRGGRIVGAVRGADGKPLLDVTIFTVGPRQLFARAGEDGRYALAGLTPGHYRLNVVTMGQELQLPTQEAQVTAGSTLTVDFQEPTGGASLKVVLGGRAETAMALLFRGELVNGKPPEGALPLSPTRKSMRSSSPRALVFERVAPGRYTLMVLRREAGEERRALYRVLEVGDWPEQTVELELPEKLPQAEGAGP